MVLISALFTICVLESSPTSSSTLFPGVKRSNIINSSEDDAENPTHGQNSTNTEHEVKNMRALDPPPVKHYTGSVTHHKKYNQI